MVLLVNKSNIFNEKMLENFEMIEYENYAKKIKYIESEAFKHFEMLKAHLKIEGIEIDIDSAYRSLETQESIFLESMKKYGIDYTEDFVAMPGYSEHHTGQAIDFVIKKDGQWIIENDQLIKEIEIFDKIHAVLKFFGFILRYPKGKEHITGYFFEPWHIRYVGENIAMEIGDLTLEEYIKKKSQL